MDEHEAAEKFAGYGTAAKPAHEPIVVARKPLSEKSVARNVLEHGTGALNIDESRIPGTSGNGHWTHKREIGDGNIYSGGGRTEEDFGSTNPASGRWPANVVLSHVSEVVEEIFHAPECDILSPSASKCVAHCPVHLAGEYVRIDGDGRAWVEVAPGCQRVGVKRVRGGDRSRPPRGYSVAYGNGRDVTKKGNAFNAPADPDGFEEVEAFECVEGCPVRELDLQSGTAKGNGHFPKRRGGKGPQIYGNGKGLPKEEQDERYLKDQGGASRFFKTFEGEPGFRYVAKASRSERNAFTKSLPRTRNKRKRYQQDKSGRWYKRVACDHPTVKPLALCRYLVRLVCPPGGTCLDPFAGSGSTLVAAIQEGFEAVGIEQDASYLAIAERRIAHARKEIEAMPLTLEV